jgi:uncharacterized membrane protein
MKDASQFRRSLMKAFCWESFSFILAVVITYWYLDSFAISIKLTSLLFVIKIIFYLGHERLWHQVAWGKIKE